MNLTPPTNTRDLLAFIEELVKTLDIPFETPREIIYNHKKLVRLPPTPCLFIKGKVPHRVPELYMLLFAGGRIQYQAVFNHDEDGVNALELIPDLPYIELGVSEDIFNGELPPNPLIYQLCMKQGIDL